MNLRPLQAPRSLHRGHCDSSRDNSPSTRTRDLAVTHHHDRKCTLVPRTMNAGAWLLMMAAKLKYLRWQTHSSETGAPLQYGYHSWSLRNVAGREYLEWDENRLYELLRTSQQLPNQPIYLSATGLWSHPGDDRTTSTWTWDSNDRHKRPWKKHSSVIKRFSVQALIDIRLESRRKALCMPLR